MTKEELSELYQVDLNTIERYRNLNLISPRRQADGQILYSQEDGEQSQRYLVLEALGLSEKDLSSLRYEEMTLERLLQRQYHKMENCLGKDLCSQLLAEGASFRYFVPEPYLEQLKNSAGKPIVILKPAFRNYVYRPWRRFFARGLDGSVYSIIWSIILGFGFRVNLTKGGFLLTLAGALATAALMIFIEPLLLSLFGTTLGKWIFGLRITNADGTRLSYGEGLSRTWGMFGKGNGYEIPIYNLVRNYKSYKLCQAGEIQPWDEGLSYTIKDLKWYRIAACIIANCALYFVIVVIMFAQMLPPNRGNITVEEFAENYNYFCNYFEYKQTWRMDETGKLVEKPADGKFAMDVLYGEYPQLEYQVDNGVLTGVSFAYEVQNKEVFGQPQRIEQALLVLAFGSSDREVGIFKNFGQTTLERVLYNNNINFTVGNMRYFSNVWQVGYDEYAIRLIPSEDAEDSYYKMEFSITKEAQRE